jgi:tRNA (adenine57-N1/adenine58-N1)-methyltransferase
LYPKDIGYILVMMGIAPGQRVMEAGTGSGSMTIALATTVGPDGQVISYEQKQDNQNLARKNVERVGLASRVDFKLRDIQQGFDETEADAFFLDVQFPHEYLEQVRAALKPGGFFGTLIPTLNQVEKTLIALKKNHFAFVEVCEIILRHYKSDPARIRPVDRMVAHTGYLIFARRIEPNTDPRGKELENEVGIED